MPTSVTVPAEIVQTLVVPAVITVAKPEDALALATKVPEVTVLFASEPKVMTLLPKPMVKVKVAVVEARLKLLGVKVPVMVMVPGLSRLAVEPEMVATVASLELNDQVPATEPCTAPEVTAGAEMA